MKAVFMKFLVQLSTYALTLRHLIGLIENTWTFWKYFWNIWDFILLLTEGDSPLKVAKQNTFQRLVAYKPVAYKKKVCITFKVIHYEMKKL